MSKLPPNVPPARPRRFKPYPEYKDSGIESLGRIPAHWKPRPLKRICRFAYGESLTSPDRLDGDVEVFGSNGQIGNSNRANTQGPCLVIGRKGSFGKINYSPGPVFAIDTTFFVDQRFTSDDIRWLYYVLADARLDRSSKDSAIPGLDREDAYSREVPWCPLEEQRAIAEFLDRETVKIDALVATKERLIELLQQKRTTLITQVVTKGLDGHAPLKDPGLEWLGGIPAHWTLRPIKRLWRRCDYGISEDLGGSGRIRVLTMAHVQDGEIVVPEQGCLEEVPQDLLLDHHDLLFNRTNSRDLVAKVGVFRGRRSDNVSFASYLVRMTATVTADPQFLNYLLNSEGVLSKARSLSLLSINQANLNPTRYGEIVVCFPPPGEQEAIAAVLNAMTQKIGQPIGSVRKSIERFKEYRAALISAAVTGKIDVREETT